MADVKDAAVAGAPERIWRIWRPPRLRSTPGDLVPGTGDRRPGLCRLAAVPSASASARGARMPLKLPAGARNQQASALRGRPAAARPRSPGRGRPPSPDAPPCGRRRDRRRPFARQHEKRREISAARELSASCRRRRPKRCSARSGRSRASRVAPARTAARLVASRTPRWAAPASKPSIAVLPFANPSGDPAQQQFADGAVERPGRRSPALQRALPRQRRPGQRRRCPPGGPGARRPLCWPLKAASSAGGARGCASTPS